MAESIENINSAGMVNYASVLTSIPNEVYVSTTEVSDSIATMIKNNIIVEFSLISKPNPRDQVESE